MLPAIELVDGPISTERGAYLVVCTEIAGSRWDACWWDGKVWAVEPVCECVLEGRECTGNYCVMCNDVHAWN